jgi:hypothetical protein
MSAVSAIAAEAALAKTASTTALAPQRFKILIFMIGSYCPIDHQRPMTRVVFVP